MFPLSTGIVYQLHYKIVFYKYPPRIREWIPDIFVERFTNFLCLSNTFLNVFTKETAIGFFKIIISHDFHDRLPVMFNLQPHS